MATAFKVVQLASGSYVGAPNQNPVDPTKWTTSSGSFSALQVQSSGLKATQTTACQASYTGVSFGNDQYIQVQLSASAFGPVSGVHPGVRVDSTGSASGYFLTMSGTAGDGPCTFQITDVSGNPLGPSASAAIQTNDFISLGAVGNMIVCFKSGVELIQFTDSTYTTGNPTVYILDGNSHPFTKGIKFFSVGNAFFASPPTNGTILGQYEGTSVNDVIGGDSPFFSHRQLDIMQVVAPGGQVVWHAGPTGVAASNPEAYTSGASFGVFEGTSFANAFPNPLNLDIVQVVNRQGTIVYYIDYNGNGVVV
jgi:hypothetical protein